MELEEILQMMELSAGEYKTRKKLYDNSRCEPVYLHFHQSNIEFAKTNQFTNEKRNTFMTIMDKAMHGILDGKLSIGGGSGTQDVQQYIFELIKEKSLQRPPFTILIFNDEDIEVIKEYLFNDFFVVCSLYEYALKPRVDLELKSETHVPFLPKLTPLYGMNAKKATDPHYVECIKPYYEVRTKTPLVEGEGEDNETTNFNIIIKPTSVVCKKSIP